MDFLTGMSSAQAAAMNIGLLIFLMLGLKMYVAAKRGRLPSGETTPEFNRVQRVQMNAVEDMPALMVGIGALGLLGMPAWYIHMAGLVLLLARVLHAVGLAGSSGFSIGRAAGTMGTFLVFLAVGGALLVHAFTP
jgi:uncharacterized membrane protein YecN with MAPEG domain